MYKVCSIFSQVLKLFSRGDFEKAVKDHKAERHARGFTSWGQFMAMLFCQLGRAHSLREICGGLACCEGQLKHLGVPVAPKKSTLAYANEHRPWELTQEEVYFVTRMKEKAVYEVKEEWEAPKNSQVVRDQIIY